MINPLQLLLVKLQVLLSFLPLQVQLLLYSGLSSPHLLHLHLQHPHSLSHLPSPCLLRGQQILKMAELLSPTSVGADLVGKLLLQFDNLIFHSFVQLLKMGYRPRLNLKPLQFSTS